MTIKLYINSSPANYVNKSLTDVLTLDGALRNPTSIVDPVVTIEKDTPMGFNYVYIEEFRRYYFVNGISSDANGLVTFSCHVDVLMTFKNEIKNFNGIVKRQENQYNLLLDDGIFKAYQNPRHKIVKFPHSMNAFSYILALAGNSESGS